MLADKIRQDLRKHANKEKAAVLRRFFKTGSGEYAQGDLFLGVVVPVVRQIAKRNKDIALPEISSLLKSVYHEERLLALLIMVLKYAKAREPLKKQIYDVYLENTKYINNWDLVDLTAKHIAGAYLLNKDKRALYILAKSKSLWERRIAILSTFHYIERNEHLDALKISKILLSDSEDLIHKATGWMLREIGKRDMPAEEKFLKQNYKLMPRTMLRYAIEKFPEARRQAYLKGLI